ncbi:MAG: 2-phosphosulfolactate phosphatase [Gemmataceae bacterium]|nr:2-phosphosulfolactate phosphatase [Gemmataceae bacterium]
MAADRIVHVHLLPDLLPAGALKGAVAVGIDVLRATTTIVVALASGCREVRPCAHVEEARALADSMRLGQTLLGGERGGIKQPGFDLGNSPREYSQSICQDRTLVFTTTNGTRTLARIAEAERAVVAAFVNFSAVCEALRHDGRPLHLVCSGIDGQPALEDTLLAGAFVDCLSDTFEMQLNDSARLAWDSFDNHGRVLLGALEVSQGGRHLQSIGMGDDLAVAAEVDRFHIVPEVRRDPLRIEVASVGISKTHWQK